MDEKAIVREERDGDAEPIASVIFAAFGQSAEATLVDELRRDGAAVVSLVAEQNGIIVGHILLSALDAPMPALALAPLAVAPAYQRKGVGALLVRAALDQAGDRGWSAVFVLGDTSYYGRFGFDANGARGYHCTYAGEDFMIAVLQTPVPARGRIEYPAAFGRLGE